MATMMSSSIPLVPLEIRLKTLEAQVLGVPSSSLATDVHIQAATPPPPLSRRVNQIQDELQSAISSSEALKSFVSGYPKYLPLLGLPQTSEPDGEDGDLPKPSDLLSDSAKLVMILEAASDIVGLERDLRDVEIYKKRGVEGAGQLEALLPFNRDVIAGFEVSRDRSKELEKARKDVSDLLKRYNEYTSTVSELFLDLHQRMEGMEDMVSFLERKKRKELAERY